MLVFDKDQREPAENLRLHFEALSRLDGEAQQTLLNVIDGLMRKHQAQQWGAHRQVSDPEPADNRRATATKAKPTKAKRPARAGR